MALGDEWRRIPAIVGGAIRPKTLREYADCGLASKSIGSLLRHRPGQGSPRTWNQFPLQVKFPVGSFLVPSLTGSNPHATKLNTSGNIGGPSGAFEFQIATPRADHTMTPAKFKAALAWLQFIGTPQHDQEIVNEGQMAVPILKGTHPSKSMTTMAYHPVTGAPWDIATSQASSAIWQDFVNYLDGQMTFKQVKASFETAEAQTYAAWMKEYHWKF